jgi:Skp family chaperone for outer membrane proteins
MKTLTYPQHPIRIIVIIAVTVLLAAPQLWSQQNQLADNLPSRIALVDHLRLRKDYKALYSAKERMVDLHLSAKRTFDASIKDLEDKKEQKLKEDAKTGGRNKAQILKETTAERAQLTAAYYAQQKSINENMNAQMRAYENKISAVITVLMSQGGFTELRALKKGEIQNGVDITSMVLEKLN